MADPEFIKIQYADGMFPDMAPSKAKAHWRDGSWVRWVGDDPAQPGSLQSMGGWEKASFDQFNGKIRKILQYSTNLGYPAAALGGSTSTWSLFDGELYFTTPVVTYGTLSNPFTVASIGTTTVSVAHASHGRATGDFVNFPESPVVTGSGITLTSGHYAVTFVDANTYTITQATVSTGTASGVGGTVDYEYFLAGGNEFGLGGAGYGTGAYDVGTYGGTTAATFTARTWTLDVLGQNIIGAPRGGGVYELSPNFAPTELVTNGTFAVDANWTKGANWTISAGAATAATSSADLSQSITIVAGSWNLIKFNVSAFTSGTVQPKLNGVAVGGTIAATGRYFLRVWGGVGGAQTLAFTGAAFVGSLDNVSVKVLATFAPVTNAPTQVTGVLVTPKGHVEVWGAVPTGETAFDPMCIKSSDADDDQTWTPDVANEAREEFLFGGSRIITGVVGGDQVFYLTDTALHERTYRGSPSLIWSTLQKGNDCGAVGISSAGWAAGRLWWMGNNKTFWTYAGAAPEPLQCPGRKWVFDNIQFVQQDLIEFHHKAEFKEVWWIWPDKRDNTNEVSRYAAFNYERAIWTFGSRVRTSWGSSGAFGYMLAAGTDGYLYFHEKGDSADGSALDGFVRSGGFDIGDGNTLAEISGYIPDTQEQVGSYTTQFFGYALNRNSTPEDSGALAIGPSTESLMSFFVQGRQIEQELRWNDAPFRLRQGLPRFLIQDTGNQF